MGTLLAAYDYSIVYRPGSKLANAGCLSRLPMSQSVPTPPVPGDTIMLLEKMEEFPVNVSQIRTWTNKDPLSSHVKKLVQYGLHEAHPGIARMKALARCLVWWTGIDAALQNKVDMFCLPRQPCSSC